MNNAIITITNISKKYILTREKTAIGYTLKEYLMDRMSAIGGHLSGKHPGTKTEFWALRSISLEIPQGEVLGIIGANGAGKSTLLKILSKVTKPTEGTLCMHGNVVSLLEVGTGFHPDLTGQENIFFSGLLLGLSRTKIAQALDQIIAFADIQNFIDVPVRYYSSGMIARLSFAIAIFLKPNILIIDEALAVGDAAFQKKCITHFESLAKSGVTIIMASHDMSIIQRLATRCIYLERGKIKNIGASHTMIGHYLQDSRQKDYQDTQSDIKSLKQQYNTAFGVTATEWLLYHQNKVHFIQPSWMGVRTLKNPLDAWIYQEILYEVQPDIVLEIGSYHGGSTLYLANILDCIGHGKIISIDIDRFNYNVTHNRIQAITGDSRSADIIDTVHNMCAGKNVLIIHDSSHESDCVSQDLKHYSDLVSIGSYFIVEDGIIDLFQAGDGIGSTTPGPLGAITTFLKENPCFIVDKKRERYVITYNPMGFLRRIL